MPGHASRPILLVGVVALLGAGGALASCAGPSSHETVSRYEFQRDQERCWLQTTNGIPFRCPQGPCVVSIPDRIEFQHCMELRGWELEDLDVAAPRRPVAAPEDDD